MIDNLPVLAPDAARSACTMSRCHERLAARRRKGHRRNCHPHRADLAVDHLLLASACAAYLVAMAINVLSIAAAP